MLAVVLASLGAAWVAIEVLHNLRITIFQPFRMATVARGLALVLIAGRLVELWERGQWFPRLRSVLIGVALVGDWMLVVVTSAEAGVALCEWLADRPLGGRFAFGPRVQKIVFAGLLGLGLVFLSRHDTESGHWPLLAVLGVGLAATFSVRWATRAGQTSSGQCEAPVERAHTWPKHAAGWGALRAGLAGSRSGLLCRPGSGRPSRGAVATGSRTVDTVPVWGHAGRRCRAVGRLVPRAHTVWSTFYRSARSQDLSALVTTQPGVQSRGQPVSSRGPRGLVPSVSRSRGRPRTAGRVRPRLPGGPAPIRSSL